MNRRFSRGWRILTIYTTSFCGGTVFGDEIETVPVPHSEPVAQRAESLPRVMPVHLELGRTELTKEAIVEALGYEFGVPVVDKEGQNGLHLRVGDGKVLASYQSQGLPPVERSMDLPDAYDQQLDTVALLAGNLARDEAGALLAQLQANIAHDTTANTQQEMAEKAPPVPQKKKPLTSPTLGTQPPATSRLEPLEESPFTISLAGPLQLPPNAHQMRSRISLGLFYSDLGNVDGFAASFIAQRNRGLGTEKSGRGVQIAGIWQGSEGHFRGFSGAGIAVTEQGGTTGVQTAGIAALQKDEVDGFQGAGVVAFAGGSIQGAQIAGISATSRGDLQGAQLSGVVSLLQGSAAGMQGAFLAALTTGNIDGAQISGGLAYSGNKIDGLQMGMLSITRHLDGTQLGMANVTYGEMKGVQIGLTNYSSDFKGTKISLLNVGGHGKGVQIGLVNVGKTMDGVALAPLNFIPGMHHQLVTYTSYTPVKDYEGLPGSPMGHIGLKFVPGPVYTQLSFGVGTEAEECPEDSTKDCLGGGVEFATGFAIGVHSKLFGDLFSEIDVQYQFEKAFNTSSALRHAILTRFALGYAFTDKFAVIFGGGPRLNLREAETVEPAPELSWSPHLYAGIQLF